MKVEIWSDVVCPFCYIGKRKFEMAFAQFPHKDKVELVWKSFQLAPGLKTQPDKNVHQFLSAHKGISLEQAKDMNDYVTKLASQVGLVYNFDQSIVANTFNAHRLSHFAKEYNKQDEAEEVLFRAYFTDGKNIDDNATLVALGKEIGLDAAALQAALENGSYTDDVQADIDEAGQIGVNGVPFFVFNRRYAVSGAQDAKAFLETLERSFGEWKTAHPAIEPAVAEGQSCQADGRCD